MSTSNDSGDLMWFVFSLFGEVCHFLDDSSCSLLKILAKGIKTNVRNISSAILFPHLYHLFPDLSKRDEI